MIIILNADDLGWSQQITEAIIRSFDEGLCSSATLMANMPAFEQACELAHDRSIHDRLGLHLVLRDGPPLSEEIKRCPRFFNNGMLSSQRLTRTGALWLQTSEKYGLAAEIRAQISRCRKFKIPLTHLDSHYHIHTEWSIGSVTISVAREEGIRFIRLSRNCGSGIEFPKRLYKFAFNRRLRAAGLAATKYFGSLQDYLYLRRSQPELHSRTSMEVMLHPRLDSGTLLINYPDNTSLKELIAQVEHYRNAVSFGFGST